MLTKFEQFIRERQYLHNVTPATVQWHTHNLKWLRTETPSQEELNDAVMRMREKGLKATGCNSAIRSINAYLKWSGSLHRLQQMKEPNIILPTLTLPQVGLLVNWKPKGFYERRLHLIVLTLLDTGCRITEALFRYIREFCPQERSLLLSTREGRVLGRPNTLRAVKALCKRLGFNPPARTVHAFRHTFAVNYLRKGGSVFHLQKVLGHSSLEMTRRYANLMTEDLQAVHQKISLLAA